LVFVIHSFIPMKSPAEPCADGDGAGDTAVPTLTVTRIEVTGMCCQSEVSLIDRKLKALPGVSNIAVNLMIRQVAVTHDERTPPARLVRTLNWSLLGASLVTGTSSVGIKRGGCNAEGALAVVCGVLWACSFPLLARDEADEWAANPFSYPALACIALGSPVMAVRALSGLAYQRTVNMFATMAIATAGAALLGDFWEAAAIVFFFAFSEWLQAWCVHHTADKTAGLGGLLPELVSPADGGCDYPLDDVSDIRSEPRASPFVQP
jgi:Cd2+/Zn2+-exporting ATPase